MTEEWRNIAAVWGAITGTLGFGLALYSALRDRSRVRIAVSYLSQDEIRDIDPQLQWAGGTKFMLVDVINAGRRTRNVYYPELWVVDELGVLKFRHPLYAHFENKWDKVETKWRTYRLAEGEIVSFLFRLREEHAVVRVDLSDSLAKFLHHKTSGGQLRWFRAKLKETRVYRDLRHAMFGKSRPRHHRGD